MPGKWWKNIFKCRSSSGSKNSRSAFAAFFRKYFKCCFSTEHTAVDEDETQAKPTSYQVWIKVPPQIRILLIQIMYGIAGNPMPGRSSITYGAQELPFGIGIRQVAKALIILDGCILDESSLARVPDHLAALNWIRKWCSMDVINNVAAIEDSPACDVTCIPHQNRSTSNEPLVGTSVTCDDQIDNHHLMKISSSDTSSDESASYKMNDEQPVYLKKSPNSIHWMKCMSTDIKIMDEALPKQIPYLASNILYPVEDNRQVLLGTGSYGEVSLNRIGCSTGKLVAVKSCFRSKESGKFHQFIDKLTVSFEARVMLVLSEESDVFPLVYGVCNAMAADSQWSIVMEFVGSATSFQSTSLMKALASGTPDITAIDGLHIALSLAEGVKVLQNNGLIHNDLATRNVLVYHKGPRIGAKIIDFGSVCTAAAPFDFFQLNDTDEEDRFDRMYDNPEHAPELFYPNTPPSFASDIYSLGVIIEAIAVNKAILSLMDISGSCVKEYPDLRPSVDVITNDIVRELNHHMDQTR